MFGIHGKLAKLAQKNNPYNTSWENKYYIAFKKETDHNEWSLEIFARLSSKRIQSK